MGEKIEHLKKKHKESSEIWILIDAVDSGLDISNIRALKEDLFPKILEDKPEDQEIYLVVSAHSFEMSSGEQCFDVQHGEYITFDNYEMYRDFICKSREIHDEQ